LERSANGEMHIMDLGSTNGTLVNGRLVTVALALRPGDQIEIGNHVFVFHDGAAEASRFESTEPQYATTIVDFSSKLVTVVVADIRGFTDFARGLDEAKLSALLGSFFRGAGSELTHRGAFAQKYVGDAVMALWIHTRSRPTAGEFSSIFEGISALARIAFGLQRDFALDKPVRISAGINTGMASIGNIGTSAFTDYTALGDTVTKAFRLQAFTKTLADVIIGGDTFAFLTEHCDPNALFEKCSLFLKGYEEPQVAYGGAFAALDTLVKNLNDTATRAS